MVLKYVLISRSVQGYVLCSHLVLCWEPAILSRILGEIKVKNVSHAVYCILLLSLRSTFPLDYKVWVHIRASYCGCRKCGRMYMHCQIMDGGHLAVRAYASECIAVYEVSKDRVDFRFLKKCSLTSLITLIRLKSLDGTHLNTKYPACN
jgi:hypothetical protein